MSRREPRPGGDCRPVGHVDDRTVVGQLPGPPIDYQAGAGGQGDDVSLREGAALKVGAVQPASRSRSALDLGSGLVIGLLHGVVLNLLQLALGAGEKRIGEIAQGDQAVPVSQGQRSPGQCRRQPGRAQGQAEFGPSHVASPSSSSSSRWEII